MAFDRHSYCLHTADMSDTIVITGGSGFLGAALSQTLLSRGYQVISLDIAPPRVEGVRHVHADLTGDALDDPQLQQPYAVINLAGKSINGSWTKQHKQLMRETRVDATRRLVAQFADPAYRPSVFISASAVGYYGDRGEVTLTENDPPGETFLAKLAQDWETEALRAADYGVPTTIIRNGFILGDSGLLGTFMPIYKLGLGGPIGDGSQWMPWISLDDCAELYATAVAGTQHSIINAVAPEKVRNREFSRTLARTLHRPHLLWVPTFALRLLYDGFADEVTASQRVSSLAHTDMSAFAFSDERLAPTLQRIVDTT